jgi:phosphoglycolate phosphatase
MQQREKAGENTKRRAVIFDFDGTIADSFPYVFQYLKMEARNTHEYTAEEQDAMRKMSMKRLALHLGVPVWRMVSVYFKGRRYLRAHLDEVQPFKNMSDVIRTLHELGYELYVVSANSRRNVRLLLEREGLIQYFVAAQGNAGFAGKIRILRYLLKRRRLNPKETWYVGDETGDVVAAVAAGMQALAVAWGFADANLLQKVEPHAFAEKPSDIVRIIEGSWKK